MIFRGTASTVIIIFSSQNQTKDMEFILETDTALAHYI